MDLSSQVQHPDAACVICGYSLTGLHAEGRCPECGTPVEHSLRGNLLAQAAPEYLRKLHTGVFMILTAIIINLLLMVAGIVIAFSTGPNSAPQSLLELVGLASAALGLIGWWLFSSPDPGYEGRDDGSTARRVIRAMVCIQAAWRAIVLAFSIMPSLLSGPLAFMSVGLGFVAGVAWLVQFFAAMLYIRWLAPRIPNPKAHKRAKVYMWLLPLIYVVGAILIIGPFIALVLYWNMLDWIRKDLKAIRAQQAALAPA